MKHRVLISAVTASAMAIGFALSAAAAPVASPISVTLFPGTSLNNANSAFYNTFAGLTGNYIVEDFEDRSGFSGNLLTGPAISGGGAGEIADVVGNTRVGSFTSINQATSTNGTGSTCGTLNSTQQCKNIGIQVSSINGQGNTIPFRGTAALNSNDTLGIVWNVDTGGLFSSLVFVLRDAADQGLRRLVIETAVGTVERSNLPNNGLTLVQVDFGAFINSARITMETSTNDGFTFDGGAVNVVPLPAGAWLLLAGIGGLAALRRRQKA